MSISLERYVAIDCEMVQCRGRNALARVAVVDHLGTVVFHSHVFVHPANVVSYLTESELPFSTELPSTTFSASGVRASDLEGAPTFATVRAQVAALLKDTILVGHAVFNDLAALEYRHIYEDVRDTALFYPLRQRMGVVHEGQFPGLRALANEVLGRDIQNGEHSPIEDARTAMNLFLHVRHEYEEGLLDGNDVIAGVPNKFTKWYW